MFAWTGQWTIGFQCEIRFSGVCLSLRFIFPVELEHIPWTFLSTNVLHRSERELLYFHDERHVDPHKAEEDVAQNYQTAWLWESVFSGGWSGKKNSQTIVWASLSPHVDEYRVSNRSHLKWSSGSDWTNIRPDRNQVWNFNEDNENKSPTPKLGSKPPWENLSPAWYKTWEIIIQIIFFPWQKWFLVTQLKMWRSGY